MLNNTIGYLRQRPLTLAFAVIVVTCIVASIIVPEPALLVLPFGAILVAMAILDYKYLYYLLFFCIPLSIETELSGGLATDLPTEPLMWLLMMSMGVWLLLHWSRANFVYLRHPVTVLLLMHFLWIFITTLTSEQFIFSFKFFLAKIWYLIALFVVPVKILRSGEEVKKLVWLIAVPLLCTIIYVLYQHAQFGFSFESSNHVMYPFYRNHVIYACVSAVFVPYLFQSLPSYRTHKGKYYFLVICIIATILAINFAYTRAAYVALVAAGLYYFVVRWRLTKVMVIGTTLLFAVFVRWVTTADNYLLFAPDFSRTVTHKKFENLLEATTKLEDISTMERVYRWVAASRMVQEKPWTGFGPSNFYSFYTRYTVRAFTTYVSDNPEKSGIHNYYLMTLVEQGIFGFLIFITLCFTGLILGERTWHQLSPGPERRFVMAATQSHLMLILLMLMNDLVETDKLGSFFFLNLAILVSFHFRGSPTANAAPTSAPRSEH